MGNKTLSEYVPYYTSYVYIITICFFKMTGVRETVVYFNV